VIPAIQVKEVLKCKTLPDYIDDTDCLLVLNCGQLYESSYLQDLNYAIGIWISAVYPREDGNDEYCRVTNGVAELNHYVLRHKLDASPNKLQRDLWLSTSQKMQVSPTYFSKRISGYIIGLNSRFDDVHLVHSTEELNVGHRDPNRLSNSKSSFSSSRGILEGAAFFELYQIDNREHCERFAVVFGYSPDFKQPFAAIVKDCDEEAPLDYDFQKCAPFKMQKDSYGWWIGFEWLEDCLIHFVTVRLATVMYQGTIFTELRLIRRLEEP
jgi:hypothetical protein